MNVNFAWNDQRRSAFALRLGHCREVSKVFESSFAKTYEENPLEPSSKDLGSWIAVAAKAVDFAMNVPNLFRRSLFSATYALVEHQLNEIAHELQHVRGLSLTLGDIRGNGIEKARTYLTKVGGISFPTNSTEWSSLQRFGKLRNVLAHQYGIVREDERDLRKWIESHPKLDLFPGTNGIWIDEGFIEEVLDTIEAFFLKLGYDISDLRF